MLRKRCLIDFDETRTKDGLLGNLICVVERLSAVRDRRDGESVEQELLEGELSCEGDDAILGIDALKLLDDGLVLGVEQYQRQGVDIDILVGDIEAEFDLLVLGLDVLSEDIEGLEGLERDCIDVGAAAWNNEALDSGESKVAGGGGEEGLGRRSLLLDDAEETLLLAFVSNDRRDETHGTVLATLRKDIVDVLQCSEDNVRESCSECDRALEVRDGEVVLARLNGIGLVILENGIGTESMKLLYCKNDVEIFEDLVFVIAECEAVDVVGDVLDELVEESYFEDLVESN